MKTAKGAIIKPPISNAASEEPHWRLAHYDLTCSQREDARGHHCQNSITLDDKMSCQLFRKGQLSLLRERKPRISVGARITLDSRHGILWGLCVEKKTQKVEAKWPGNASTAEGPPHLARPHCRRGNYAAPVAARLLAHFLTL